MNDQISRFKKEYTDSLDDFIHSEEIQLLIRPLNSIFPGEEVSVLVVSSINYDISELKKNTSASYDNFIFNSNNLESFDTLSDIECEYYQGVILLDFFGIIENDVLRTLYRKIDRIVSRDGIVLFGMVNPEYIFELGFSPKEVNILAEKLVQDVVCETSLVRPLCSEIKVKTRNSSDSCRPVKFAFYKKGFVNDNITTYRDMFLNELSHGSSSNENFEKENKILRNEIILLQEEIELLREKNTKLPRLINKILGSLSFISNCFSKLGRTPKIKSSATIYVDISQFIHTDSKTGIQRVLKSIIINWLDDSSIKDRVKLVYSYPHECFYRLARFSYDTDLVVHPSNIIDDIEVHFNSGDIFFGLDFQPEVVISKENLFDRLRSEGVNIQFVVYDLLPIKFPEYFPNTKDIFENWLLLISKYHRVHCISKSVTRDYSRWLKSNQYLINNYPQVDYFHLGADALTLKGNDSNIGKLLTYQSAFFSKVGDQLNFLMVGTLEPRKGHKDILLAFELLWQEHPNVNLIIVGRKGWMSDELVNRIVGHSELGKRLFWLEGINDIYLSNVYMNSNVLIAASYDEGFGLPIIESAQRGLPIIARDIEVFREVAGDGAFYFPDRESPELISKAIHKWIGKYDKGTHPKPDCISIPSWKNVSDDLLKLVL